MRGHGEHRPAPSLESIADNAFDSCLSLQVVYVVAGSYAEQYCAGRGLAYEYLAEGDFEPVPYVGGGAAGAGAEGGAGETGGAPGEGGASETGGAISDILKDLAG